MVRIFTMLLMLLFVLALPAAANIDETIEGIIDWKKEEQGLAPDAPLLQHPFLQNASYTNGDWYPFALGRLGYTDDFEAYLTVASNSIQKRYEQPNKLDETKATEWHRTTLAINAVGGDATDVEGINLIADGTYNRAHTAPLGTQGINGWIWGLIAVDSLRYKIPQDAATTRSEIIKNILQAQLPDGGFSFYHDTADVDITAMALQALAPYANSFQYYSYTEQKTGQQVKKTVRQVVDEALQTLSTLQTESGDFGSWGEMNAESTAQVLTALSSLQIDALSDERFIKNGHTVIDGLMRYRQQDGGFIHSENYNPENPTSLPDESNSMASEQALYALIAYKRSNEGYRSLYDMREEMPETMKKQIAAFDKAIAGANLHNKSEVQSLLAAYEKIPAAETMYLKNFKQLYDAVQSLQLNYETAAFDVEIGVTTNANGTVTPLLGSEVQIELSIEAVEQFLQQDISTADYSTALRYREFLKEQNENKLLQQVERIISEIEAISQEIEALNEEILQHIYPISSITLDDKERVLAIQQRFNALPADDQQQIINYEDLQTVDAHLTSLQREKWLKIGLIAIVSILAAVFISRMLNKRRGDAQ